MVDHPLQLRLVLSHHDRVGLDRQVFADYGEVVGLRRFRDEAIEQHVVHREGDRLALCDRLEGIVVVGHLQDGELQQPLVVELLHHLLAGRALGDDDRLAAKVLDAVDVRRRLREHLDAGDVRRVRERDVLLAVARVRRRSAFEVDLVLQQRGDPVGGADRHEFHLEALHLEFGLDRFDDLEAEIDRVALRLLLRVEERERYRRLAHADEDRAGIADALQRVDPLDRGGGGRRCSGRGARGRSGA